MNVIDFEINLCRKRVFTNDLLLQWVVHKERAERKGEGRLESNKNWSDVAERREKSKLKVET